MKKQRNHLAAGFLLLGIGTAGRALLGGPEGVTAAELSLTVLLVVGALLLGRESPWPVLFAAAAAAVELVLCSSWVQAGGALAAAAPFVRLADLWLLFALAYASVPPARRAVDELKYTGATRAMLWACGGVLALHTALRLAALVWTEAGWLANAASVSFVAFSAVLLWFTVLMLRAYNAEKK